MRFISSKELSFSHLRHPRDLRDSLVQADGIEPTIPAWKAGVLPLNYACDCTYEERNGIKGQVFSYFCRRKCEKSIRPEMFFEHARMFFREKFHVFIRKKGHISGEHQPFCGDGFSKNAVAFRKYCGGSILRLSLTTPFLAFGYIQKDI